MSGRGWNRCLLRYRWGFNRCHLGDHMSGRGFTCGSDIMSGSFNYGSGIIHHMSGRGSICGNGLTVISGRGSNSGSGIMSGSFNNGSGIIRHMSGRGSDNSGRGIMSGRSSSSGSGIMRGRIINCYILRGGCGISGHGRVRCRRCLNCLFSCILWFWILIPRF